MNASIYYIYIYVQHVYIRYNIKNADYDNGKQRAFPVYVFVL